MAKQNCLFATLDINPHFSQSQKSYIQIHSPTVLLPMQPEAIHYKNYVSKSSASNSTTKSDGMDHSAEHNQ